MNKRIMIATNLYQVDPQVYASHMNMIFRAGKIPDLDIFFSAPWRLPIDKAREMAVKYALQNECKYLFFYDDDMFLDPNIISKMVKRFEENEEIHILQAKAYIRGYPYDPMIFKYVEEGVLRFYVDYEKDVREDGLVKVDATGCCSTMIDCELFKLVPEPWFVTGPTHTEDVYFCVKAAKYVDNIGIYMDNDIESGHLLDKPILTSVSRDVLIDIHEKSGLNQIWMPEQDFTKDIKYMKNSTSPSHFANPIENFDKFIIAGEEKDDDNNSKTHAAG